MQESLRIAGDRKCIVENTGLDMTDYVPYVAAATCGFGVSVSNPRNRLRLDTSTNKKGYLSKQESQLRHVVKGTMKCDVSMSPDEQTFAPLQPTSPSFGTSALDGGPSDGVTVTLRDEALHNKTLSKEALAARNDRRLYAWPCPEEPTTDLTEFEHCVSTKVENRRNSQNLFAWREVLVRKFPCGACRRKRSGRIQEDLFVRSCYRCNGIAVVGPICFVVKQNDGMQHFADWLLNKAEDFDDGQAYRAADGFKCRWLASSTTTLPAGRTLRGDTKESSGQISSDTFAFRDRAVGRSQQSHWGH